MSLDHLGPCLRLHLGVETRLPATSAKDIKFALNSLFVVVLLNTTNEKISLPIKCYFRCQGRMKRTPTDWTALANQETSPTLESQHQGLQ